MIFASITFLFYFLPIFMGLYLLADKQYKNGVLLIGSVIFYAWGAPQFVFILLGSTFLDFYLVKWMHESQASRTKKILLTLSISLNVGLLLFFKYSNFAAENVNAFLNLLGLRSHYWAEVALPIGISFYTFQTLTYSIDVYRKVSEPLKNVWDYMVYIIMFPQLIAGPIVRYNFIAQQLRNRVSTAEDVVTGFIRFSIGLGKKVLIANYMAETADGLINGGIENLDATTAWIAIIAYTFQIYFDFSGYSDMAIGLGRITGFRFPENFDNPYTSASITEFWRRWHITLGAWMRDYLYIPLGGSKVKSNARLYLNLWIVFLISGLWHGASWNFVLWGAFHGFWLVIERIALGKLLKKIPRFFSVVWTFFLVVLGWVIFRIEAFADGKAFYAKLFSFEFSSAAWVDHNQFYIVGALAAVFAFWCLIPGGRKIMAKVYDWHPSPKLMAALFLPAVLILILSAARLAGEGFNPFIYFRF